MTPPKAPMTFDEICESDEFNHDALFIEYSAYAALKEELEIVRKGTEAQIRMDLGQQIGLLNEKVAELEKERTKTLSSYSDCYEQWVRQKKLLTDCESSLNAINSAMINGDWKYAITVVKETLTRLRESRGK